MKDEIVQGEIEREEIEPDYDELYLVVKKGDNLTLVNENHMLWDDSELEDLIEAVNAHPGDRILITVTREPAL